MHLVIVRQSVCILTNVARCRLSVNLLDQYKCVHFLINTTSKQQYSTMKRILDEKETPPPPKWRVFSSLMGNYLGPYGAVLTSFFVVMVLFIGGYYYIFPDKVRDRMANEVSTVASKSLSDDELMANASILSKEVVYKLLHDETVMDQTSKFVTAVLMRKDTKEATSKLMISVVQDPQVIDVVSSKLKDIFVNILDADQTREVVLKQVVKIIKNEDTKSAFADMLKRVTSQPEVRETFLNVVLDVLKSQQVLDQGNQLGQEIATTVLSDKEVQKAAGAAVWPAVKFMFSRQPKSVVLENPDTDDDDIDFDM